MINGTRRRLARTLALHRVLEGERPREPGMSLQSECGRGYAVADLRKGVILKKHLVIVSLLLSLAVSSHAMGLKTGAHAAYNIGGDIEESTLGFGVDAAVDLPGPLALEVSATTLDSIRNVVETSGIPATGIYTRGQDGYSPVGAG